MSGSNNKKKHQTKSIHLNTRNSFNNSWLSMSHMANSTCRLIELTSNIMTVLKQCSYQENTESNSIVKMADWEEEKNRHSDLSE